MSTQIAGSVRALAAPPPLRRSTTPLAHALEALGGFRPLILWGLFWSARPFSDLMRHVPEITKKTLRRELTEMERLGLVRRESRPGSERRAEYSLSPLGETLRPIVGSMYEWGLKRGDGLQVRPARAARGAADPF